MVHWLEQDHMIAFFLGRIGGDLLVPLVPVLLVMWINSAEHSGDVKGVGECCYALEQASVEPIIT